MHRDIVPEHRDEDAMSLFTVSRGLTIVGLSMFLFQRKRETAMDDPLEKLFQEAMRSKQGPRAARSRKRAEAEARLPAGLRPVFNDLVMDYETACSARLDGYVFRHYNILADLVLTGWRKMN